MLRLHCGDTLFCLTEYAQNSDVKIVSKKLLNGALYWYNKDPGVPSGSRHIFIFSKCNCCCCREVKALLIANEPLVCFIYGYYWLILFSMFLVQLSLLPVTVPAGEWLTLTQVSALKGGWAAGRELQQTICSGDFIAESKKVLIRLSECVFMICLGAIILVMK